MKTTMICFTTFTITCLALTFTGCGSKEYNNDVFNQNAQAFREGKSVHYKDPETNQEIENFTLPEEGVFRGESVSDFVNGLGYQLTEFYWDVRFLSCKKIAHRESDNRDIFRVRFRARDKKTPAEIQKSLYLAEALHIPISDVIKQANNSEAKSNLITKYGESEATVFSARMQTGRLDIGKLPDVGNQPTAAHESPGSSSVNTKSARQLLREHAQALYGRNADIQISSGYYGGAYQVVISVDFHTYTYSAEVDERAGRITAWQRH